MARGQSGQHTECGRAERIQLARYRQQGLRALERRVCGVVAAVYDRRGVSDEDRRSQTAATTQANTGEIGEVVAEDQGADGHRAGNNGSCEPRRIVSGSLPGAPDSPETVDHSSGYGERDQ